MGNTTVPRRPSTMLTVLAVSVVVSLIVLVACWLTVAPKPAAVLTKAEFEKVFAFEHNRSFLYCGSDEEYDVFYCNDWRGRAYGLGAYYQVPTGQLRYGTAKEGDLGHIPRSKLTATDSALRFVISAFQRQKVLPPAVLCAHAARNAQAIARGMQENANLLCAF